MAVGYYAKRQKYDGGKIMNSLNKQLTALISLLFITACNGQSNLNQSEKKNTEKMVHKSLVYTNFECHSAEYKFNILSEVPEPLPYEVMEPISIVQQRQAKFWDGTKRLPILMDKELIVLKLQELGFIEYSNNEIYKKYFGKKDMYRTSDFRGEIYSVYIFPKDIAKPECPYSINIYYPNSKVNGVEIIIGNDGLILKDTTIPDLVISTINHKNKPDNLFKDLLDKHIQNIETFKQKQPLNEELISTRAIYDGITYEINSFGGGRVTMLQIYRYKDRKKSH
jgi:hypothetical protein